MTETKIALFWKSFAIAFVDVVVTVIKENFILQKELRWFFDLMGVLRRVEALREWCCSLWFSTTFWETSIQLFVRPFCRLRTEICTIFERTFDIGKRFIQEGCASMYDSWNLEWTNDMTGTSYKKSRKEHNWNIGCCSDGMCWKCQGSYSEYEILLNREDDDTYRYIYILYIDHTNSSHKL